MKKNKELKFTIVIPIYKTEAYLEECIESVINQTYKNIEIILVNDGSPGNAEEICKNFVKKNSKIKYFSKENEGVAIARNFGISNSSGDYIFCLDSDDTIETQFIEKIIKRLKNNEKDLIIIGEDFCKKQTSLIGALPTWAFAIKKCFLEKYPDVRFIENLQPCEDGLFSHKLLALTNNIIKCPEAKYYYRQHENSSEHTVNGSKIIKDIPRWFEILEKFYDKYNLWTSHKLHLLAFIENEPFSLRLQRMNLDEEQEQIIYHLIKSFIHKHSLLTISNKFYFKKIYRNFLLSNSYENFIMKNKKYKYKIFYKILEPIFYKKCKIKKGNIIILPSNFKRQKLKLKLNIAGKNNLIDLSSIRLENKAYIEVICPDNCNNNVLIFGQNTIISNIQIRFLGSNNKLVTGKNFYCQKANVLVYGDNNTIHIKNSVEFHEYVQIFEKTGNYIEIGNSTTITSAEIISYTKGTKLIIGDDCMFSREILIYHEISHPIYNTENQIINKVNNDMIIGNHVWIGRRSIILPKASIASGNIIGANSVVTKTFNQANIIIAGNPAKKIKENIHWKRTDINMYEL